MSLPVREQLLTAAEEFPTEDPRSVTPRSRAVKFGRRDLEQVLALVAIAEREQQHARTQSFHAVVVATLMFIIVAFGFGVGVVIGVALGLEEILGIVVSSSMLASAVVVTGLGAATFISLRRREKQHRRVAAETGETIREVISSTDWNRELDPLEWAHLRTRVAQLELVDLSSLR